MICASQETYRVMTSAGWQERPLPKGEYKDTPNNPTSRVTGETHAYAPPIDVPAEMSRLVRELRSPAFDAAHPVLQAAWAHYAFVAVHPFADGNGRVARALASVFLYRRPGVPLVIFADQKDAYLDGLEEADRGHPRRFVRFVQGRVADAIGLVQVAGQSVGSSPAASLASLRETFLAQNGVPLAELDQLGGLLYASARDQMVQRMSALDLPTGIEWVEDDLLGSEFPLPPGYRPTTIPGFRPKITIRGLGVSASVGFLVGFATSSGAEPAFRMVGSAGIDFPVELREIFPTTSAVLGLKLSIWADNLVAQLLANFDTESRRALRDR